MNRILSKEVMKRSRLKNKFLKSKSEADKKNYVNRCANQLTGFYMRATLALNVLKKSARRFTGYITWSSCLLS